MKISTLTKICTRLNDLHNVSTCDVFMTPAHPDRIIISLCLKPDLLGSIVIREQAGLESYEVTIDSKQLAKLYVKSTESDFDIPERIVKLVADCDLKIASNYKKNLTLLLPQLLD
jgi:hypothetical protein